MSQVIKSDDGGYINILDLRVRVVLNGIDENDPDMRLDESDITAEVEEGVKSELIQFYEVKKVEATHSG